MRNRQDNRREFQRLELPEPLPARLGDSDVRIIDLGVLGARVELQERINEDKVDRLKFEANGEELEFECIVAHVTERSATTHSPFHAGLLFSNAIGSSDEKLRKLLTTFVTAEIERMSSHSRSDAAPRFDPEATAMRIPAPFLSFRFEDGIWRKRPVFIPNQPETGFTLPATEDANEINHLKNSYEHTDESGRALIRLFAELHVCQVLGVPTRS